MLAKKASAVSENLPPVGDFANCIDSRQAEGFTDGRAEKN